MPRVKKIRVCCQLPQADANRTGLHLGHTVTLQTLPHDTEGWIWALCPEVHTKHRGVSQWASDGWAELAPDEWEEVNP